MLAEAERLFARRVANKARARSVYCPSHRLFTSKYTIRRHLPRLWEHFIEIKVANNQHSGLLKVAAMVIPYIKHDDHPQLMLIEKGEKEDKFFVRKFIA
ncbi:unnamed protein product [Strongylus vulgaris]|uniref:Uncharacterized protein n=1 Tax=Strongylus vulgaris TaxID=40348 RepID=A0A3P7LA43_STRVU|nr:unnamed protein product [Strongylus vulgaris]